MRPVLLLTLALVLLGAAAPRARAQERPEGTLPALKAARDAIDTRRSQAMTTRDRCRQELGTLRKEHAKQSDALRALQDEKPLLEFYHRRKVEAARRALRLTSVHIEQRKRELEAAEESERSLRLELIEAIRAYVNRLSEVANRLAPLARGRQQADAYYAEAEQEMRYLEDLESLELDPGELELPALAEERRLPRDALSQLLEAYRERAEDTANRAAALQPRVEELQATLLSLEEKAERGFVLPHLSQLIERTRDQLARVALFQTRLRERTRTYADRVIELERILGERAVEQGIHEEDER